MTIIDQLRAEIAEEVLDAILTANEKWTGPPYERDEELAHLKSYHVHNILEEVESQFGVKR